MKDFITDHYNITGKTYRDMDIIVDPAAASFILQMRRFHMKSKRGNNDVLSGIRTVASLINERKLKVCDRCTGLIHEIHTYSWDAKAQARGVDAPAKKLDHACDSLRYIIMWLQPKNKITKAGINIGI